MARLLALVAVVLGMFVSSACAATVWTGDFEEGGLDDIYYPETGPSGNYGGGEYNSGSGDTVVQSTVKRSGTYAAQSTLTDGVGGTRLFRWKEPREVRQLWFSAYFRIPEQYTLTEDPCCGRYWNIFQFKSRSTSGAVDPLWYVDLQPDGDGHLKPTIVWWSNSLEGPHSGESGFRRYQPLVDMDVPVNSWFRIRAYLKQSKDFDGRLIVNFNGTTIFDQSSIRTSYNNCAYNSWCAANEWSTNLYSDGLDPYPSVMYTDDMLIEDTNP